MLNSRKWSGRFWQFTGGIMQGFTGGVEIYRDDCIVLHKFSEGEGVPVFVVPPHAGRHGNIVQNLVNALVAEGKPVYAYELLPATKETSCISVFGLVDAIGECVARISDKPVEILGVCQGAWLSSIYTALHQDKVHRLALFAGPINTKTGHKNIIEEYCRKINMDYHRAVVQFFGGIQPAAMQWLAFAGVAPYEVFVGRFLKQAEAIWKDDKKAITSHALNNDWYDKPQDLGEWFLQALENHFVKNELYEGTWEIADGIVPKLEAITCPVHVFAGGADDITHPEQARGILDKVSSSEKHYTIFPDAGHSAVFARPSCIQQFMTQFYGGNQ